MDLQFIIFNFSNSSNAKLKTRTKVLEIVDNLCIEPNLIFFSLYRVVASRANLKCAKNPHNGQVVYETLENIAPNTDLVVSLKFFDNYHSPRTELSSSTVIIRAIAAYMQGK